MPESPILSLSFKSSSFRMIRPESDDQGDNLFDDLPQRQQSQLQVAEEYDENEEHEFEFEFSVVSRDSESSSISADEIFHNGQIRPIYYGLFDRSLAAGTSRYQKPGPQSFPLPLGRLLKEEREMASWSDELEGLVPESYCLWTPKKRESVGVHKKSNSTGSSSSSSSSKRWKLRNILYRNNSDGKENLVYLSRSRGEKGAENGAVEGRNRGETRRSFMFLPRSHHRREFVD